MTPKQNLKGAATRYVRAVFSALEVAWRSYPDESPGLGHAWTPRGGAFVLETDRLKAYEVCLMREVIPSELSELRSSCERAIEADSRFKPFVGEMIGTASSGGRLMTPDGLMRELLVAVARAGNGLSFSVEAFGRGYAEWVRAATAKTHRVTFVAPINLKFEGTLRLHDGLELTQLSDDEIIACLNMGMLQQLPGGAGFAVPATRVAIRDEWAEPRGLLDDVVRHPGALERSGRSVAAASRIVEALRLFKSGQVSMHGYVKILGEGVRSWSILTTQRVWTPMELDAAEATSFAAFYRRVEKVRQTHGAIDTAIRRFTFAGDRLRKDDEIVDLVAALEALLLSGTGEQDRGEMRFRTALRGSLIAQAPLTSAYVSCIASTTRMAATSES